MLSTKSRDQPILKPPEDDRFAVEALHSLHNALYSGQSFALGDGRAPRG